METTYNNISYQELERNWEDFINPLSVKTRPPVNSNDFLSMDVTIHSGIKNPAIDDSISYSSFQNMWSWMSYEDKERFVGVKFFAGWNKGTTIKGNILEADPHMFWIIIPFGTILPRYPKFEATFRGSRVHILPNVDPIQVNKFLVLVGREENAPMGDMVIEHSMGHESIFDYVGIEDMYRS